MSEEKLWQAVEQQAWGEDSPAGSNHGRTDRPRPGVSRRSFIELIGYSVAGLALSNCRSPEQKIIPYVKQPVELTPGVASWYASTCGGCSAACGILVKVRDGRPIKLEGNPEHPLSRGGLCAVAHAMVFGLYDAERLRQPHIGFETTTWEEVDRQVGEKLAGIKRSGGKVRLLTKTLHSPTSRSVIEGFLGQFADGKHIVYEPVSNAAVREAHLRSHGRAVIPAYHLDRARLIAGFGADFLGTWISPVQFTLDYSIARKLENDRREFLRHIQFESRVSLTGSNADVRVPVSAAEELEALVYLAQLIGGADAAPPPGGLSGFQPARLAARTRQAVEQCARDMRKGQGVSLVLSGINDVDVQYLVNWINNAAGNYGKTIEWKGASEQDQGDDRAMDELVREMNAGEVAALIVSGANPAYDYHGAEKFTEGLSQVPVQVSLNPLMDETSAFAEYACPQHHFLESWNDAEPVVGTYGLTQPTVAPLFQTRAFQETLLRWSGDPRSYYDVLREYWREKFFPQQKQYAAFDEFWDRSLHDGVFVRETPTPESPSFQSGGIAAAVEGVISRATELDGVLSLVLYPKVSLRDGTHAGNPWLQEFPDPITKITWDNYACVSPKTADSMQLEEGGVVQITKGKLTLELPVHIQPGQHDATVAVALGYGRTKAGKAGNLVGANAYPLVSFARGCSQYTISAIGMEKTPRTVAFATTQPHDSLEGRPIIKEWTFAQYLETGAEAGRKHASEPNGIYSEHAYAEHKWGLVVDLNACVGCSACMLSCQAENNVPVVGREEVQRQREMHWIRVDRYFEGPNDNLKVKYQVVMCNQCDNASCESVCPVLATVHSSDGLNMQVYNRCVGTRYCANNCPYKVRRFNWFDHPPSDPWASLALNPDVTVRTRGVMEKCTFCVQRIEEAKILARNENRPIRDGEIQPACQQSCPAGAIVFGDLSDSRSRVAQLKQEGRNYLLLEELNLKPAISYLAKIRNQEEAGA